MSTWYTTKWFDICVCWAMITTVSLVNVRHHMPLQNFFSSDENFLVFTRSNCHICSTVLLTVVNILYITSWVIGFIIGSLYFLTPFTHFVLLPPPACGHHQRVLCISELGFCFLLFFDSTDKWDHVCLSLSYFTQHNALKIIHVVADVTIAFLFMTEEHSSVCTCLTYLSIHPSVDTGCFCALAVANNAAVNMAMHISFWVTVYRAA